jgi:tetratricopeptide (TPR) repeat protein
MSTYTKYLPHISVTAFIIFLAADYFPLAQKTGSLDSVKSLSIDEGSHKEVKHSKGNNSEIENLSQEEREHRMAIFHYNEGNKFYNEENYSEAIIRYEKALHHNKKFKEVLINLSTAYMKNKVLDKALKTIQAGQNQFPQEPLFDYNYACYYSLRKNLVPGLSALKQAVEKGFKQFKQIENDSDLIYLRQSDEYKTWKEKMSSARTT